MIVNILAGVLLGYIIFNIGKLILYKSYNGDEKQNENQHIPRFYKTTLNINAEANSFKRKIKLAIANRSKK